jgi:hypothetical protein
MSIGTVLVYVLVHTLSKRCRRTGSEVYHVPRQFHLLTYGSHHWGKYSYLDLSSGTLLPKIGMEYIDKLVEFYVHVTLQRNKFLCNKTN